MPGWSGLQLWLHVLAAALAAMCCSRADLRLALSHAPAGWSFMHDMHTMQNILRQRVVCRMRLKTCWTRLMCYTKE